ncbi:6-phosphofructokinase PfkA [Aspergillus steynii IBT 23096]|uniref:ATP-dependent 6-phosphofructokinase n=1 Tax=Aspergillus steynii IBT 23096 TaxID=1392250 RepID=A0A2I2G106_9EURO|nr:6-phosphofructokinase PfkA [Aspergillus steynii IBT 23096]PLB46548.1 6-phosphofructokinase PfkA [Aspergillus steynii IBT 23096]
MATTHAPVEPPKRRRIGVLTSGGDAPGMNGAVRAVVRMAIHSGCEAYAVYEGYEGLVEGGDMIRQVHWEDVRGWLSRGGTLIGSARCLAFRERAGRLQGAKNLVLRGIDALVVCGGDGSLTGADVFRSEWPGLLEELVKTGQLTQQQVEPYQRLNIVGLVGSIDNDMSGTDATIGCYSSLTRICDAVDDVFDTAFSHQRGFVIEVMGRHCGWLALMAAISTGADWLFVPEMPPRDGWEDDMCSIITKNRTERGNRRTIVIVAEGAQDRHLNKISSNTVKDILTKRLNLDTRVTVLGHTQRGGAACAYDRWLSTLQGVEAVRAVLDMEPTTPSPVITIRENKILRTPLMDAVSETKKVTSHIENREFDTAMALRDSEFKEYHFAYRNTATPDHPKMTLPENKRMRIAIIHVGAPAGGMNPATRAAVGYCLTRGHTPLAIHNGFPGLCRHHDDKVSSVREVQWVETDPWVNEGGSDIGTNRSLPSEDFETTAKCFKEHKFDALFVIGGFEAFTAVSQLRQAREKYPAFKIPMTVLPATISNNVPGTEYSLGSDTCLNTLIDFCDAIRQSASSSRRRVFVVETQGGKSGYIATTAGLAVGASAVYIPEEGIDIKMLSNDIDFLRDNFANDKGANRAGKIILRNETASKTYTTQFVADMMKEEAKGRFESRSAVPGHFQQGGKPSPMDRIRALRMAIRCMLHLESYAGKTPDEIAADELSASVIGIKGSQVLFSPMGGADGLEATETDWTRRRPKAEFWLQLQDTVNILSGRSGWREGRQTNWGCYESV